MRDTGAVLRSAALGAAAAAAGAGVEWLVWAWIAPYVWLLFFPAIFISARWGGRLSGLVCTALGTAFIWYIFLPPRMAWTVDSSSQVFAAGMFLIIGFWVSDVVAQLRRSNLAMGTRFEAVFEQAGVGIAMVAPDGRWLRVNQELCGIVGYSRDELLGLSFQDITHPDDLDKDLALVGRLLAKEIPTYTLEKRYLRKTGEPVWIALTVSIVRCPSGEPDYFIAIVKDIHERKQTEAALRESQAQLALFIKHAPAALAMFDRDMRYLAASQRWADDYSLDGENLIGRSHYEVLPEVPERWRQIHRRAMAGEVITADEDSLIRKDGSVLWLRWEVRPWQTDGGQVGGIVIFTEDITGRKRAEASILQLNQDLERRVSERTAELVAANRELDAFAYAVSHDLRAPLRAMSGFSRALLEDYGDRLEGEARVYLDQIDVASQRMGGLIDGLLTLSRTTRGELQRDVVDLSALAERVLAELQRAEPERAVVTEIEGGLQASCDGRMVEVALHNLLANAWKYTSQKPVATIRFFRQNLRGTGYYCVADDGAGFDMAHAGKLFQPFQRLHRQNEFPGIGIGLATVQRIVQRHGGSIEAAGEPGKGAQFYFTLVAESPAAESHSPETS